ncbi:MAG: WD40 repeat domain-containing protein, partial [Zavarzinella sp.]|nr:WD40 repeat domain-containing protein [Zavarzinella sp.]
DPRKAGGVRVIDRKTGEVRQIPLDGDTWESVQVSPDGKYVSSEMPNQAVRVWDAGTGRVVFEEPRGKDHALLGHLTAPDGRGLALSLRGTWPRVTPATPGASPSYAAVTLTDHRSGRTRALDPMPWAIYANGARFTRDGTRLVLHANYDEGRDGGSLSVWDVRSGRRLMNWKTKTDGYICAHAAAPDTRGVLVGDSVGTLTVVEVATGGERAVFRHHGRVYSAAFAPDGTKVAASSPEAPVYVWDLIGEPAKWEPAKADAVWADLASTDAKAAFAAVRKLRANPAEAVAFLKERVKPSAAPTDAAIAGLLKRLDGPRFADREQAQKELASVADLVRPKLEAARKAATEEVARRLDQVLKAADEMTAEKLRQIRACEVLEGIGAPDAVRLLKGWAGGPAGARLTLEAKESLDRLKP